MYRVAENGIAGACFPGGSAVSPVPRLSCGPAGAAPLVGVSVSSGMLDLKIDTGDIPPEELVDLLYSYRQKKKYHRLKNGTFVRMEESFIGMLDEMTAALRLTPKEMIREICICQFTGRCIWTGFWRSTRTFTVKGTAISSRS